MRLRIVLFILAASCLPLRALAQVDAGDPSGLVQDPETGRTYRVIRPESRLERGLAAVPQWLIGVAGGIVLLGAITAIARGLRRSK